MSEKGVVYNIQRMSVDDGPGIRTTVFFKGCPLSCSWCSNPESQSYAPQLMVFKDLCTGCGACERVCPNNAVTANGNRRNRNLGRCLNCGLCAEACPTGARAMSGRECGLDDVMAIVRKDSAFYHNSDGGVTFGGGECTAQGSFLLSLLQASRDEGLHTCVDTCGCCAPELFEKLLPLTDLFLYDLKHMDPAEHKRLTGVGNKTILANLRTVLETAPQKACVRVPLLPGVNDGGENIQAMADLLKPLGHGAVEIMPYHLFGRNKHLALSRPVPDFAEYTPEALQAVLERFARCGLVATVV